MRAFAVFAAAFSLWLCTLQLFFRADRVELVQPLARGVLASDPTQLRGYNPEWDLMARTFSVLAFANLSFEDPAYLEPLARIADETDALERRFGPAYYLLPYGAHAKQSLFVDGEIALMLATRQLRTGGDPAPLRERVARIERQLESAPLLLAESYPDEGWVFCNTIAIAALKVSDAALASDHSDLINRWLASVKTHLIDPRTGLLISSFHRSGAPRDGPEGSTLWLAAHMLQLVDPAFAADQYQRARAAIGHSALGFGWAGEWPSAWEGNMDIDSGPTIPLVDANAGSSGLAILGAAAFHDDAYLAGLLSSLKLAAFPVEQNGALHFAAGNVLADAVTLYSLVQGPLWACVREGQCSAPRS